MEKAERTTSHSDFDPHRLLLLFQSCHGENNQLFLDHYISAFEEFCRLFRLFGAVFGFVASDVMQKVGILQDHRQGEQGSNYETLQTMVQYEVENNLVVGKKKPSGCSALLPLHRALEFICDFLIRLHDSDNSCRFSTEAVAAYDATIAKYHPWIVRKVVHVALYAALPRRQQLLIKMKVDDSAETLEEITCLIHSCQLVFDTTQELFSKHDLLGIPVA